MALIAWSYKLSVNNHELDQQHKKLIDLINFFFNKKAVNEEKEILGKVLNELVLYTKTHFKKEEELMEKYEYPYYTAHKLLHDSFIQELVSMYQKHHLGNNDISIDIVIFLNDWLVEHILIEDKRYSPYLIKK